MTAIVIARRFLGMLATLVVASVLIYGAIYIAPGNPATLFAGSRPVSQETLDSISRQYHLDDPFLSQYWRWLTGALTGDFGQSFVYREDVGVLLGARAVNTVLLVAYASLLILLGGVAAGVVSALRGGVVRSIITAFTAVGMAVPVFVASIALIVVFAVNLGWFPVFGSGDGLLDKLRHLTLPAVALSLAYLAYVAQITREAVGAELGREHVMTARSRGVPERLVVRRHVLRNAAAPVLTVSGITVAGMTAGAIVAEKAFQVNGLGSFLVDAVQRKDFAVVQAIALLIVAAFVITNTTVDLATRALDPRTRRRGRA